jgi:hypothetical protein
MLSFFAKAQHIYSGSSKGQHKWQLRINADSSVNLVREVGNYSYEEYKGHIQRLNDTLFDVNVKLDYAQSICRAISDSILFVTVDTLLQPSVTYVMTKYAGEEKFSFPVSNRSHLQIPVYKRIYRPNTDQRFFSVYAGHKHAISQKDVVTNYKLTDEYGLEIYSGGSSSFKLSIKKGIAKKIGKGGMDPFILTKQKNYKAD